MPLDAAEVEVLLRACRKYRGTIAPYLQVSQPELAAIDAIVARLESALGTGTARPAGSPSSEPKNNPS